MSSSIEASSIVSNPVALVGWRIGRSGAMAERRVLWRRMRPFHGSLVRGPLGLRVPFAFGLEGSALLSVAAGALFSLLTLRFEATTTLSFSRMW